MSSKNQSEEDLASIAFQLRSEIESSLGKVTHNSADAQDLFQQLIERLVAAGDRPVEKPVHYIRTSVRNLGMDWIRRKRQTAPTVSIDADEALTIADPEPTPEDLTAAQQELAVLLAGLPPKCGEVFRLVKIEGFSHEEVAQLLNISIATVKSHLKHAVPIVARLYHILSAKPPRASEP